MDKTTHCRRDLRGKTKTRYGWEKNAPDKEKLVRMEETWKHDLFEAGQCYPEEKFEAWENKNRNPGYGRNIDRVNRGAWADADAEEARKNEVKRGRDGVSLKVASTNVDIRNETSRGEKEIFKEVSTNAANKIEASWKKGGMNGGRLKEVSASLGGGDNVLRNKNWTPREAMEEKLANGDGMARTRWNGRRTNGAGWNYTCDTNGRMENMVTLSEDGTKRKKDTSAEQSDSCWKNTIKSQPVKGRVAPVVQHDRPDNIRTKEYEGKLVVLRERLEEAKLEKDHEAAQTIREQIWVLNDMIAGIATNIPKGDLDRIKFSIHNMI